jgi:CheY-like chemotaxis protein
MAKILVAEDDPTTRLLLSRTLEALGHRVHLSPDGRHALATLECNPGFDLLISDMVMPEMDGRALINAVRRRGLKLTIVIMSAVVGVKEIADLLARGATFFLAKPIKIDELREYVARGVEPAGAAEVRP